MTIMTALGIFAHGSIVSYTFDGEGLFSAALTDMGNAAVSRVEVVRSSTFAGGQISGLDDLAVGAVVNLTIEPAYRKERVVVEYKCNR